MFPPSFVGFVLYYKAVSRLLALLAFQSSFSDRLFISGLSPVSESVSLLNVDYKHDSEADLSANLREKSTDPDFNIITARSSHVLELKV